MPMSPEEHAAHMEKMKASLQSIIDTATAGLQEEVAEQETEGEPMRGGEGLKEKLINIANKGE
jgi:hypothetical protein